MKKQVVLSLAGVIILGIFLASNGFALELGQNITVSDLDFEGTGWHSDREDNETEPGTITKQKWDLEAFFLEGTALSMVGGYDFANNQEWPSGDIFLDVTGDMKYGNPQDGGTVPNGTGGSQGANPDTIANVFGYDYVIDLDFSTGKYNVYELTENSILSRVYYNINEHSNAWRYESGGEPLLGEQEIVYQSGLTDTEIGNELTGGSHNVVTVDLGFLGAEINNFSAHFTMECGNDNLIGHYDPVPEPSTILLLGAGLLGIFGIGRKQLKK